MMSFARHAVSTNALDHLHGPEDVIFLAERSHQQSWSGMTTGLMMVPDEQLGKLVLSVEDDWVQLGVSQFCISKSSSDPDESGLVQKGVKWNESLVLLPLVMVRCRK